MFPIFSSNWKTEQDVRECIARPLINALGYSADMVTTELTLRYERRYFGRKKPKSDPPLCGRADYLLEVPGALLRVIVETKPPGPIMNDDREQAFTYAIHPEIRAVFFIVISGTDFEVWCTNRAPEAGPVIAFGYEKLNELLPVLANVLSPAALLRDFGDYQPDLGLPLGPNLRSFAKVEAGKMRYCEVPPDTPALSGMTLHFAEGFLQRIRTGGILLVLRPSHSYDTLTDFQDALAPELVLNTTAETLSTDEYTPTVFVGELNATVPAGTPIPDGVIPYKSTPAAFAYRPRARAQFLAHLEGLTLRGPVEAARSDISRRVTTMIELALR